MKKCFLCAISFFALGAVWHAKGLSISKNWAESWDNRDLEEEQLGEKCPFPRRDILLDI